VPLLNLNEVSGLDAVTVRLRVMVLIADLVMVTVLNPSVFVAVKVWSVL